MRPRLFVELCAGLASVSLRLQGGPNARPPVSRMGNKQGYAGAILAALGLRAGAGGGADAYLFCEPDAGCRALLQAYGQPDVLKAAAAVIRGWKDEDPRELWERLREEGPIRGADGREVARFALINRWSFSQRGPDHGYGGPGSKSGHMSRDSRDRALGCDATAARLEALPAYALDPREVARWLRVVSSNRLINVSGDTLRNTGEGGSTHGGAEFCTPIDRLAEATEAAAGPRPPIVVAADARAVDPREVARWAFLHQGSFQKKGPDAGMGRPQGKEACDGFGAKRPVTAELIDSFPRLPPQPPIVVAADARAVDPREVARWAVIEGWTNSGRYMGPDRPSACHGQNWTASITRAGIGTRLDNLPAQPPTLIAADAREVDPPPRLEGVVVYIDPPYQGTTGYGAGDLSRAEVIDLARRWHEAGAIVAISEQEPIEGWADELWTVDLTAARKGQKRTFSRQQREILTLNCPPAADAPREQLGLFGG